MNRAGSSLLHAQGPSTEEAAASFPVISADGLTLYIKLKTNGRSQIAYLRRATREAPWSPPEPLPGVTAGVPVWESADGCRLYVAGFGGTTVLHRN